MQTVAEENLETSKRNSASEPLKRSAYAFRLAALVHLFATVVVFAPFLFLGRLPLWSTDNLFGAYPALEYTYHSFRNGVSGWIPYILNGANFWASVNNFAFCPFLTGLYLLPPSVFWIGVTAVQLLAFWLIGMLSFSLKKRIVGDDSWGLFGSICYQLSLPVLFSYQIFPAAFQQVFFLLGCYSVWAMKDEKPLRNFALLCIGLTGLMLTGHFVYGFHYGLIVTVLFFYRNNFYPKQIARFGTPINLFMLACVVSLLIGSIRWLPFADSLASSSRMAVSVLEDRSSRLYSITHMFLPEIFGVTNPTTGHLAAGAAFGYGGNLHEFFHYYGVIAAFFVILAFIDPRVKGGGFWKILALIYLAIMTRFMPLAFLSNLIFYPFLHSSITVGSALAFCTLAAYAGKCLAGGSGASTEGGLSTTHASKGRMVAAAACITAFMLTFAVQIWQGFWGENGLAITGLKLSYLVPAALLLLCYGYRHDARHSVRFKKYLLGAMIAGSVALAAAILSSFPYQGSLVYMLHAAGTGSTILVFAAGILFLRAPSLVRIKWLTVPLAAGIAASLFIHLLDPGRSVWVDALSTRESFTLMLMGVARLLLAAGFIVMLTDFRANGRITPRFFVAACCLISLIDGIAVFRSSTYTLCRPFLDAQDGRLFRRQDNLPEMDLKNYRVNFPHQLVPKQSIYTPIIGHEELSNIPVAYNIPSYGGVNSQYSKMDYDFLESLNGQPPPPIGFPADSTHDRFLDLIGARYDFRSGSMTKRGGALSRFMLYSDYEVIADPVRNLERLNDPGFEPLSTVLISDNIPVGPTQRLKAIPLDYEAVKDDRIHLSVKTDRPRVLLFNDSYDPGWEAFIDENRVPVGRANFKFMAIAVPGGEHEIRFVFRPRTIRVSWILLGMGLILFVSTVSCPRPGKGVVS